MSQRAQREGLRDGSVGAFQRVYDEYTPRLYRFLLRLSGDSEVAQDLLQDTWMSFARHAHRLDCEADLTAWLFTVARNRHRSWRRWALFDQLRLDRLRATPLEPAQPADSEYALTETQVHLERAIQRLSPALREVVLLVAVEGMGATQAARVLDIQPEAVRQRLSRARGQLATHLSSTQAGSVPAAKVESEP